MDRMKGMTELGLPELSKAKLDRTEWRRMVSRSQLHDSH